MEPAPSAQIVGQEFVKQYYTMLNAAPEHLHRLILVAVVALSRWLLDKLWIRQLTDCQILD